jgi:hypothetical protein
MQWTHLLPPNIELVFNWLLMLLTFVMVSFRRKICISLEKDCGCKSRTIKCKLIHVNVEVDLSQFLAVNLQKTSVSSYVLYLDWNQSVHYLWRRLSSSRWGCMLWVHMELDSPSSLLSKSWYCWYHMSLCSEKKNKHLSPRSGINHSKYLLSSCYLR